MFYMKVKVRYLSYKTINPIAVNMLVYVPNTTKTQWKRMSLCDAQLN